LADHESIFPDLGPLSILLASIITVIICTSQDNNSRINSQTQAVLAF
jgi:hypothetical protein